MNIALVANDNKKKLMENLCIAYRHILNKHTLFATETTGRIVEEAASLSVRKYLAGHLGGEQQHKLLQPRPLCLGCHPVCSYHNLISH